MVNDREAPGIGSRSDQIFNCRIKLSSFPLFVSFTTFWISLEPQRGSEDPGKTTVPGAISNIFLPWIREDDPSD